jgi:hypothetical protein
MPAPLKALAAFVLVLGLAVPLALSFDDSSEGVGTQPTAPVSSSADVETQPTVPGASLLATWLIDSEVEVPDAVAPFDHESFVDSLLLEFGLARVRNQQVFDCIAAAGLVPPSLSPLPDRDDPMLYSADFPNVAALARDGFPDPTAPDSTEGATPTTAAPGTGSASGQPSEAYASVSRQCADQVYGSQSDAVVAHELYASIRSAWELVLAEIEATDEIRSLVNGFGACLRDREVPAGFTTSEGAYLGYVDSLLAATEELSFNQIRESTGKLYAECGSDLFAAREALRGGARREAFLGEHQESISQLWNLLLIIDSSPPIDTAVTTIATTTTSLGDEALLACMVGTWSVDMEGFAAALQANIDPRGDTYVVTVESGDGSLTITGDSTFAVSYDGLTIRIHESGHTDTVVVVSGEVTAGFTLQGNVFLAGEIDGDPLVVLRSLSDGTWAEVPPVIRDISLRLGTPASRPLYMEKVTIDCSGDRLVVNDEVRIDTSTGDGPSTVWVRGEA